MRMTRLALGLIHMVAFLAALFGGGGAGGRKGGMGDTSPEAPLRPGCASGKGGKDVDRGAGGRAVGGYSLAIVFKGADIKMPAPEETTFELGKAGTRATSKELIEF